jgi:imidazolonepropionase
MNLAHVHSIPTEGTLVLRNAACLITMQEQAGPCEDAATRPLGVQKKVDIVIEKGRIVAVGKEAGKSLKLTAPVETIDASRWVVMPGLVDAHTHPLFAGSRSAETVLKAQGMSYEEIAARGGGIGVSTSSSRAATTEELSQNFIRHAQTALARGVTLMEAKTGYGLSPAEETRHLQALLNACASESHLPRIAPTFLGPHAASPDYGSLERYIDALVDALPQVSELINKGVRERIICSPSADIFIERNYFDTSMGDNWLGSALKYGLNVHIHAEEFSRSGACELAAALARRVGQDAKHLPKNGRILSVDHCQYATETDLADLAELGVAAIALPLTSFVSGIPYVDGNRWRASGVRIAIASDFNPGSAPINNLWLAAYLGLTKCKFTLAEVYAGITTNAAFALGMEDSFGTVALGREANLVAFRGDKPEDLVASPLGDHVELVLTTKSTHG